MGVSEGIACSDNTAACQFLQVFLILERFKLSGVPITAHAMLDTTGCFSQWQNIVIHRLQVKATNKNLYPNGMLACFIRLCLSMFSGYAEHFY